MKSRLSRKIKKALIKSFGPNAFIAWKNTLIKIYEARLKKDLDVSVKHSSGKEERFVFKKGEICDINIEKGPHIIYEFEQLVQESNEFYIIYGCSIGIEEELFGRCFEILKTQYKHEKYIRFKKSISDEKI